MNKKILVTGALGQIGSELVLALKEKHGSNNVVASDLKDNSEFSPYEKLDILDQSKLTEVIKKHKINTIYHLAAILSAVGEINPQLCFNVNIVGLYNILEASRLNNVKQIICPSSIAAFGPETPKKNVPQQTILLPKTIYGVTKVSGELICDYYVKKYGIDIRGVRYPGLISYKALPGGGTTDYAVEIFYEALKNKKYECFLKADTILPMMFMDDAIRGTMELADADFDKLTNYCDFNFAAISFSCQQLADEIKKHIPEFEISYKPDYRQEIADSWPSSIDDSQAQKQWGWKHEFNLEKMVKVMIEGVLGKIK